MDTHAGLPLPLEDHDLDSVSGGFIKGALEGVCRKDDGASGGRDPAAQMFQHVLQQLTQGQG